MTSSATIFHFYQNHTIAVKYNHLQIFGENFIKSDWDFRLWQKKIGRFAVVFSLLEYTYRSE